MRHANSICAGCDPANGWAHSKLLLANGASDAGRIITRIARLGSFKRGQNARPASAKREVQVQNRKKRSVVSLSGRVGQPQLGGSLAVVGEITISLTIRPARLLVQWGYYAN